MVRQAIDQTYHEPSKWTLHKASNGDHIPVTTQHSDIGYIDYVTPRACWTRDASNRIASFSGGKGINLIDNMTLLNNRGYGISDGDPLDNHSPLSGDSGLSYCEGCGEYHHNVTHVEGYGEYCECCLDYEFYSCEECGEYVHEDDAHEVYMGDCPEYVCSTCKDNYYTYCDACGNYHRDSEMCETGDGDRICETCIEAEYSPCANCGELYLTDDLCEAGLCSGCCDDDCRCA